MEDAGRQKWSLTKDAFDGLLASFAPDRDLAADRYLQVRRNLVRLFEWRGCAAPEEYADEVMNRCAKKVGEGEEIRDVGTYCIGIARMMLREMSRDRIELSRHLEEVPAPQTMPNELPDRGSRLDCLRSCLGQLSPEHRDLILQYYDGAKSEKIKSRKVLILALGIPPSTLRMRALRVRERLQLCTESCLQSSGAGSL